MKFSETKKMITRALFRLMEEDQFQKITITQIAQEAQIERKTFYLNYDSKEAVIRLYIIYLLSKQYTKDRLKTETKKELWLHNYKFFFGHLKLLKTLKAHDIFHILLDALDAVTADFTANFIELNSVDSVDSDLTKFYSRKMVTVIQWRTMSIWLDEDGISTPEELTEMNYRLFSE